ncbi:MAG: shikimate kinase [Bryobacteraceae bacterium]
MNLKLKRTPGIYLVGFMGCGKTTIGRNLAERLGWRFVDVDGEIEAQRGLSIPEIFDTESEERFREIETEAIRRYVHEVQNGQHMVLALGGGAFAQAANFDLLANNGLTVWLDCPLDTARRRVEGAGHRPLARDPVKFGELYHARREFYARADLHISIQSDDPGLAVESILRSTELQ